MDKSSAWFGAVVGALAMCASLAVDSAVAGTKPAPANSRVTGSYYGVFYPHDFSTSASNPVNLQVGGGIMTYALAYNTLGYYQAVSPRCVAFIRGRAVDLTVSMISSPFGGLPSALTASDLDLLVSFEADLSSLTGNLTTGNQTTVRFQKYRGEGIISYVRKAQGEYFPEPIAYRADDGVNLKFTIDMGLETSGNAAVVSTEVTATVPGVRFEAKKVSDQLLGTYTPRVRIRR
jgi:hypothetical protein